MCSYHGFATIIIARRIGSDFLFAQQVTVGYDDRGDSPVIGDRVRIGAGAIVIGPITIGDDAVIGAGPWSSRTSRPAPSSAVCPRASSSMPRTASPRERASAVSAEVRRLGDFRFPAAIQPAQRGRAQQPRLR